MNNYEAARRVIEFLESMDGFRELIERINQSGEIADFATNIADAIATQELE